MFIKFETISLDKNHRNFMIKIVDSEFTKSIKISQISETLLIGAGHQSFNYYKSKFSLDSDWYEHNPDAINLACFMAAIKIYVQNNINIGENILLVLKKLMHTPLYMRVITNDKRGAQIIVKWWDIETQMSFYKDWIYDFEKYIPELNYLIEKEKEQEKLLAGLLSDLGLNYLNSPNFYKDKNFTFRISDLANFVNKLTDQ